MWDAEVMFSHKQAVAATALSDNSIACPDKDIASGQPVQVQVMGTKAAGGGTMNIVVQTGNADDMSDAAPIATYHLPAKTMAKGGPILSAGLPAKLCKRRLRLQYVPAGTLTGLKITAGLVLDGQTNI